MRRWMPRRRSISCALVCGLGVGLLVVSLAFTAFVFKQNRDLVAGKTTHERQIARLQANERSLDYLVRRRWSSTVPGSPS
jgi:hypothetical protein